MKPSAPTRPTATEATAPNDSENQAALPRKSKLAEQIATQIETQIIRLGWPVGQILGSEAELTRRYAVSRWTMREAIGIMERDGLVSMRRGRNGGLVVAAPAPDAVGSAIRNYLEFSGVAPLELIQARRVLEEFMVQRAIEALTPDQAEALRALARECASAVEERLPLLAIGVLHKLLEVANNAALTIFTLALSKLTISASWRTANPKADFQEALHDFLQYRRAQIEAIIAGDLPRAYEMERAHLERSYELMGGDPLLGQTPHLKFRRRASEWQMADTRTPPRLKRPQSLGHEIQDEILAMGWPVGAHLGSEAELMKKYKVSRSVFREAIRMLERLGVVEMRTGHKAGLKVARPNPDATVRSAKVYLVYSKLSKADARDLLATLELAAAGIAAALPADRTAALEADLRTITLADTAETPQAWDLRGRAFHRTLAAACNNQIIALFLRILSELYTIGRFQASSKPELKAALQTVADLEASLAEAIGARDAARARRCMIDRRRALTALSKDDPSDILKS